MLNGTPCDCDFCMAVLAFSTINQDIRCRLRLDAHVRFDIAPADLKIAEITFSDDDSPSGIVADMTSDDVNLMEVHIVQEDADATIFVNVAMAQNDVAVPLVQSNTVERLTN